ncbi:MAG: beta-galactosidase, partial [Opitutaceae bacterium]|nr:beta-galactosidase [Opitutaceae bacterium]
LRLTHRLAALPAAHSRATHFLIPAKLLPQGRDISLRITGEANEPVAQTRLPRLDFERQIAPKLATIKTRADALRSSLRQSPEALRADSGLRAAQAIIDRFIDRLESIRLKRRRQNEEWSLMQVEELETVIDAAETRLASLRSGAIPASTVPRPAPGTGAIENGILTATTSPGATATAATATATAPRPEAGHRRPFFFYGYGHFDGAARDLPWFPRIGATLIQREQGPRAIDEDGALNPRAAATILDALHSARNSGMQLDALLSPHYFPAWARKKHPDMRLERLPGFITHNIDHPAASDVTEKWVRGIVSRAKDNPALFSVCLSNEPLWANSGHDRWTRQAWTQFLESRHPNLSRLNRLYGTRHARHSDVPPPDPGAKDSPDIGLRRLYFDWAIFNQEHFADWHRWLRDLVKQTAPDVLTHTKIMPTIFTRSAFGLGIDPEKITRLTDLAGCDAGTRHEPAGEYAWQWQPMQMWYDLLHSFQGQPVFNSENHIIRDNSPATTITPAHTYATLWQGALHHQAATTIWVWEETGNETSTAGSIYMRPANIFAASRLMLDVNRLAPELAAINQSPSPIAILYSPASIYWSDDYLETLRAAHAALTFAGLRPTFISEHQLATGQRTPVNRNIRWIVIPAARHIQGTTPASLARFTSGGGHVISVTTTPADNLARDAWDRPLPSPPSGINIATLKRDAGENDLVLFRRLLDLVTKQGYTPPVSLRTLDKQPAWGIEYSAAPSPDHPGRLLVPLTNMLSKPQTVMIGKVTHARDLVSGRQLDPQGITLLPMTPLLLEVY